MTAFRKRIGPIDIDYDPVISRFAGVTIGIHYWPGRMIIRSGRQWSRRRWIGGRWVLTRTIARSKGVYRG